MLRIVAPAASQDLIALAALKQELGIADGTQDARLAALITQASSAIAGHCTRTGFGLETLQQTERLSRRRDAIVLERDLAPTVSAVTEDGTALLATEYELDGACLRRLYDGELDQWQPGLIVVAYAAGYTLPAGSPADLQRACLDTCKAWWFARTRDPMLRSESAEGIGAASYIATADMGALPPQAVSLLAPFIRTVVG